MSLLVRMFCECFAFSAIFVIGHSCGMGVFSCTKFLWQKVYIYIYKMKSSHKNFDLSVSRTVGPSNLRGSYVSVLTESP